MILHQTARMPITRIADDAIAAPPTSRNHRFTGYLSVFKRRFNRSAGGPFPGLKDKNVTRMFLFS